LLILTILILTITSLCLASFAILSQSKPKPQKGFASNICFEIHCLITMYQYDQLIFQQYHAGAVTKLGMNVTLAKLTGDSWYNLTTYNLNNTFISIGDQGTLDTDSTVLPSEWNRTVAVVEDQAYNSFNLTCTMYPDDSGPYTADCIGINYESGIGNNALWGYDTFTQVTGIDDTFTINIEFKVTVSYM